MKNVIGCLGLLAMVVFLSGCPAMPGAGNGGDNTGGDGNGQDGTNGGTTGAKLVVFEDPDSEFSTTDVHDVEDQIVQFDSEDQSIIWAMTGASFQAGTWVVDGNLLGPTQFFQVRFGTVDGERRAYFTETELATICDIRVSGNNLSIFATNVTVPE